MSGRAIIKKVILASLASMSVAGSAAAQQAPLQDSDRLTVAATAVWVASIQPSDNTYVGANGPYLDQGLGGNGFGAAAGLSLFVAPNVVVTAEISTASVSAFQMGRLVGGSAEGTLRDTFVSTLAGLTTKSHSVAVLAGIGWLASTPSLNGVAVDDPDSTHAALAVGFDAARSVAPRTAIVANVRYFLAFRSDRIVQIGVGGQIIRAGIGLRVRLN